jgi:DhnA family fructose-bisphosphate aldolase class Ia
MESNKPDLKTINKKVNSGARAYLIKRNIFSVLLEHSIFNAILKI